MTTHSKLTLAFYGGAETVTGANFLLSDPVGERLLVDCGLFQGLRVASEKNLEPFPYDPRAIKSLFVTHAHLDHIGRIPRLVREGFRGEIFSTPPTKEMAELSLIDSLGVLEKEAKNDNQPLPYEEKDVRAALALWRTVDYGEVVERGAFRIKLHDAVHILGSAMVEVAYGGRRILFSGDLGDSPAPLLGERNYYPSGIDYLVMESVYGDREHEGREEAAALLEDVIEETVHRGGTLLIPAFSIERTQLLLLHLQEMMGNSRIPLVPVFLDSPLAINMTKIYRKYASYLKVSPRRDLFQFPQLHKVLETSESQALDRLIQPKIIIAGAGMSNGGRIVHHEKAYLADPKTTLLLVGYQAVGSLGRLLQDGEKEVTILGEPITVRARVVKIHGFSGHLAASGLLQFVDRLQDGGLRKVFLTMGEPKASLFLAQKIRDYLGVEVFVPRLNDKVELEF